MKKMKSNNKTTQLLDVIHVMMTVEQLAEYFFENTGKTSFKVYD